jgi:iron complex transport system substrate-binding protein
VASLLPSATEIVCAVGAEADLVGISHECDFPESVRHLPALTRARLGPVRSSREIDREVRAVLRDALAVYEIELERLETARPDVIVIQDLCDVCAVSFSDVCTATATLLREPVQIVNLHPTRLDDIWADIARVAEALGRRQRGRARRGRFDGARHGDHPAQPRPVRTPARRVHRVAGSRDGRGNVDARADRARGGRAAGDAPRRPRAYRVEARSARPGARCRRDQAMRLSA